MKERSCPKRIIFDVPEEYHNKVKSMASSKGMSIRDFIIRLINNQINIDEKYV